MTCNLSMGIRMEAYEEKDISYAEKMLMNGEPVEKIVEYTELSLDQLRAIAQRMKVSLQITKNNRNDKKE